MPQEFQFRSNFGQKIRLHKLIQQHILEQSLEYTQAEVARNIANYGIFVDQDLTQNRLTWIQFGQEISFEHWPKREKGSFEKIQTVFENENTLILNKPTQVVVESGAGHKQDNLLSWLRQRTNQDFFLANRLDKDTQGLIILAKNLKQQEFLQQQFAQRKVKKEYLAILNGLMEKNYVLENWQTRDKQNLLRQKLFWSESEAKNYDPQSRLARSVFQPLVLCPPLDRTLAKIRIKTGRMHQIRLQAEALGFPLFADKIYQKIDAEFQPPPGFFDLQPLRIIKKDEFLILKEKLFGKTDYCLLSNSIKLKIDLQTTLEVTLFENFY